MALANTHSEQDEPIRTMFSPPWACIRGCGACCYLAPEERDLDCMTAEDRDLYISMAGKDGELGFCISRSKNKLHDVLIAETRTLA